MIRVVAIRGIVAAVVDAFESITARSLGIRYARFMLVQIVVYTAIGFVLRRRGFPLRYVLESALALTGFALGSSRRTAET